MEKSSRYDVAIIGGGIVGLATAMALLKHFKISLIILETEDQVAAHQTGHNSGVIHSGLYYKPGSLKAINCVSGRDAMYRFCEEQNIIHERCGKIVIATSQNEIPSLNLLEERGRANDLVGMKRLKAEEIKEYEPYVNGIDGLFIPQTGIVDYTDVSKAYARIIQEMGGFIKTSTRVTGFKKEQDEFVLETSNDPVKTKNIINCAGLESDRVAKLCGIKPGLQILPFRGEYYEIKPEKEYSGKEFGLSCSGCSLSIPGGTFYPDGKGRC